MNLNTLKQLVSSRDLAAQLTVARFMKHQGRLIFYHAGLNIGLFHELTRPATLEVLADTLGIADRQLLSSLLDLGCALDEVALRKGAYRLTGATAKALGRNAPLAAMVRETVGYHGDVAQRLDAFLTRGERGEYLQRYGGIIAVSSRVTEPLIRGFIYGAVPPGRPLRILEIGCGAGEYLRYYVDINGANRGLAVDRDAAAVALAREAVRARGLDRQFTVRQENILHATGLAAGSFDLATSYSNIYYFSEAERRDFFAAVHRLLAPRGRFMLATAMKSATLASSYYDLIFSATAGLHPLPRARELAAALRHCGFGRVKTTRLLGSSFQGIVAQKE